MKSIPTQNFIFSNQTRFFFLAVASWCIKIYLYHSRNIFCKCAHVCSCTCKIIVSACYIYLGTSFFIFWVCVCVCVYNEGLHHGGEKERNISVRQELIMRYGKWSQIHRFSKRLIDLSRQCDIPNGHQQFQIVKNFYFLIFVHSF